MLLAITRQVSPSIARCELTHVDRLPIDAARAAEQHARYEQCLRSLGCTVESLPAEPDLPDSVFVEDTAVVVDELAVVTRPGAASRRPETASVARVLSRLRPTVPIEDPGTLDGGDVLRLGRRLLVGLSGRSNPAGVEQLRGALAPHGYAVEAVGLGPCLHLKSAVTQVAPDALLLNPAWVDPGLAAGWRVVEVDPAEPNAANALMVGGAVVIPAAYPRTAARLERAGVALTVVELSELAKAEGAVTCCSLILES